MTLPANWHDASAVILSCPGPLRRHGAAILPISLLNLPQILLGSESQLLAFADFAGPDPVLFAPFPEMFESEAGWRAMVPGIDSRRAVHLRFGSVRAARVLKGARNACVLAERANPPPQTASHHPFASGTVLPAAMQHVYALCAGVVQPRTIGGELCPITDLPEGLATRALPSGTGRGTQGLDFVSLADFRSDAWAASSQTPRMPAAATQGCVLVPWNMDHPGSIVPELLSRLARLHTASAPIPRMVLLPFNYIGQTGIIRDLIARLDAATVPPGAMLADIFIARVHAAPGLAALKRLSRIAWIDGNDPEHWWTLERLAACGIATLLIDAGQSADARPSARAPADEGLWIEAETRCGVLNSASRLPSLRRLRALLEQTAALVPAARSRRAKA